MVRWPSGLRRQTKVTILRMQIGYIWSERAWVRIPLSSDFCTLFALCLRRCWECLDSRKTAQLSSAILKEQGCHIYACFMMYNSCRLAVYSGLRRWNIERRLSPPCYVRRRLLLGGVRSSSDIVCLAQRAVLSVLIFMPS